MPVSGRRAQSAIFTTPQMYYVDALRYTQTALLVVLYIANSRSLKGFPRPNCMERRRRGHVMQIAPITLPRALVQRLGDSQNM